MEIDWGALGRRCVWSLKSVCEAWVILVNPGRSVPMKRLLNQPFSLLTE
jgi:hypothetical protein